MIPARCIPADPDVKGFDDVLWPEGFAAVPRVGERVAGIQKGGDAHNERVVYFVVGVIHAEARLGVRGTLVPQLEVELTDKDPGPVVLKNTIVIDGRPVEKP